MENTDVLLYFVSSWNWKVWDVHSLSDTLELVQYAQQNTLEGSEELWDIFNTNLFKLKNNAVEDI